MWGLTLRTGKTLTGGLKSSGREDQSPEGWRAQSDDFLDCFVVTVCTRVKGRMAPPKRMNIMNICTFVAKSAILFSKNEGGVKGRL